MRTLADRLGLNSRIEGRDGVRFASNEVIETVCGGGVDEAIAYPLCGLDAARLSDPATTDAH